MKPRITVACILALSLCATLPPRAAAQEASSVAGLKIHGDQEAAAAAGQEARTPKQEQLRHEEKVVVTADRIEESVANVGSAVSVITSDEIEESGALWLIEVLERAPGVAVARSGGPGAAATVFLRGTNSNHTLFMVDGVKLNSPTTGSYDLSHLQLAADQIERIEIVRGPQSPLYGSEAMGGVINVITKRGTGPATWGIEAEAGSFNSGRVHTWVNGQARAVRYAGNVSYLDTGGFSAAAESRGNLEADDLRNVSYSGRLDYSSPSGFSLDGFVRGFDQQSTDEPGDLRWRGGRLSEHPLDHEAGVLRQRGRSKGRHARRFLYRLRARCGDPRARLAERNGADGLPNVDRRGRVPA